MFCPIWFNHLFMFSGKILVLLKIKKHTGSDKIPHKRRLTFSIIGDAGEMNRPTIKQNSTSDIVYT